MSGAEVSLVLGLISSIISIINTSKDVYDAAKDAQSLSTAFKKVAENVPLVLRTLEKAQKQMEAEWRRSDDEAKKQGIVEVAKELEPVFETCKFNAKALREIFEEVVPGDEDTRMDRYKKALKTVLPGKKHKVESLMQEILEKLKLLHTYHYFQAAVDIDEVKAGIEELRTVESSLPQDENGKYFHSGSGSQNINTGSGKMTNNSMVGGSGNSQHNAERQDFNYASK